MSMNGRIAIIFNSINVTGLLTTLEEAYIYIGAPFSLFLSYPRLEELVRGGRGTDLNTHMPNVSGSGRGRAPSRPPGSGHRSVCPASLVIPRQ